jgi:Carboxypeptidase regulatory-like domain
LDTDSADDAGRFNFPQLKPGTYSVKAEAPGFEPQQNDNVVSGLGQKQRPAVIQKQRPAVIRRLKADRLGRVRRRSAGLYFPASCRVTG